MSTSNPERAPRKGEPMPLEQAELDRFPWVWAGMSYDAFEKLPASSRRVWNERWRARCEAIYRLNGRPVSPSYFAPESLSSALFRLGMTDRGGMLDMDPLGLGGPKHVEDHTPPDTRSWDLIALDAENRMRDALDSIIAGNAQRRAETERAA